MALVKWLNSSVLCSVDAGSAGAIRVVKGGLREADSREVSSDRIRVYR